MEIDMKLLTALGTAFAVIGVVWKAVIKPNLESEFMMKHECHRIQQEQGQADDKLDARLEKIEDSQEEQAAMLREIAVELKWIKEKLDR